MIKSFNKYDGKPTFRKKLNNKLNKSFSSFEDLENQSESVSYVDFIQELFLVFNESIKTMNCTTNINVIHEE